MLKTEIVVVVCLSVAVYLLLFVWWPKKKERGVSAAKVDPQDDLSVCVAALVETDRKLAAHSQLRIAFCITCRGRAQHIKQTLSSNIADNADYSNCVFVLLDYGSQDDLQSYIWKNHYRDVASGKLAVYRYSSDSFRMAHAKNMAARCGMLEGADVLVTLDADNYTGRGFARFVADNIEPGVFLCPDFPKIKSLPHGPLRPQRGYAGRLAVRTQEFIKMGGYDESFDTWRGEDIDMIARMQRVGYAMRCIDNRFLAAIPHGADVRFKEYPHAREFERAGEWRKITDERTETVVNFGNIGCGTVDRFPETGFPQTSALERIVLGIIPTRIFGIGMQKTATSSLHEAFKILGYDSFHWGSNRKAWRLWNEMTWVGRSMLLEQYYSLCDNPIPMLYEKLDKAYPGSKFILTTVDENVWVRSAELFWSPETNRWYDWDSQPYSHRIHEALYGQRNFDRDVFLARYRRHNAEVIEYFKDRPQDLLVMSMSDGAGWRELCPFLGKIVPPVPYPHANKDGK